MPESGFASQARAAETASQWGGYSNGAIPPAAMTRVPARVGDPYLPADAATAYFALSEAFRKAFGVPLALTEAYRGLARQQALWDAHQNETGNLAVRPGKSVHGWALGCDFGSGVQRPVTAQKLWMNAHALAFGWQPRLDTSTSPEAWHLDHGVRTIRSLRGS